MNNAYIQGARVRVRGVFRSIDEDLFDPTTVICMVQAPTGSPAETSHQYGVDAGVLRDSEGVYTFRIATPEPGKYVYRWKGDGAVYSSVNEDEFYVYASAFAAP